MITELGLTGLVLHNSPNLVYLTGVNIKTFERPMFLVSNGEEHVLVAPKLDKEKLHRFEASGGKVVVYEDGADIEKLLASLAGSLGIESGQVGFDETVSLRVYRMLCRAIGEIRLVGITDELLRRRYVKRKDEIENIRRAVNILDEVYRKIEASLEPGLTEAMLSSLIVNWGMELGADEVFFSAVQAGENSAIPHHERSARKIRRGDVVVIDVSLTYNNYFGDLTRVFVLGPVDSKLRENYSVVKKTVEEAFSNVKPGRKASFIDDVARNYLSKHGLASFFVHRLGHGLGVEVHEPPYLSPTSNDILADGNVFTIEPGLYFPGRYGLRLERNVAVLGGEPVYLDSYDVDIVEN